MKDIEQFFMVLVEDNCGDKNLVEKMRAFAKGRRERTKVDLDTKDDKFWCILHGDCWCNNALYRLQSDFNVPLISTIT